MTTDRPTTRRRRTATSPARPSAAFAATAACRPSSSATASSPTSVSVDAHEFDLLRRKTSSNTLVDLSIDGEKPQPVLVHGVQLHRVTRRPLHVDLFLVTMTEELTVDVPLVADRRVARPSKPSGGTLLHPIETRPDQGAAGSPAPVDRVRHRLARRLRRRHPPPRPDDPRGRHAADGSRRDRRQGPAARQRGRRGAGRRRGRGGRRGRGCRRGRGGRSCPVGRGLRGLRRPGLTSERSRELSGDSGTQRWA